MVSSDEAERLERDMSSASSAVRKGVGGKPGEAAEKLYGQAYSALVRAGLRSPIRKKYR